MIADTLVLLKNLLNSHFRSLNITEDCVVFIDGQQKPDTISFKSDSVTMLLYNIEQEALLRQGDPFARVTDDGAAQRVQPNINLNLSVLFVANFRQYEHGLFFLSSLIQYFQANNYLNHQNTRKLHAAIDRLVIELTSLSMSQQSELWGMLRSGYLPSVAYKVKTLVFRSDHDWAQPLVPSVMANDPMQSLGGNTGSS